MVITKYQIFTTLFFVVFIGIMANYNIKIRDKKDE